MNTLAEELQELTDRWRDAGSSDEEIINALMDEIERLEPGSDDSSTIVSVLIGPSELGDDD